MIVNEPSPEQPTVPWTGWDILWAGLSFVALLAIAGGFVNLRGGTIDGGLLILVGEALILLPTWYFTVYRYGASWHDLGLRSFDPTILVTGCGAMMAFFALSFVYGLLLTQFDLQVQPELEVIFDQTEYPVLLFIGGALVAPFVEEVLFRGMVFQLLRQHQGWLLAAVLSSVLFALIHITPTAWLPIFLLGFIFAYLTHLSGSIWPAIIIHAANNSLALTLTYLASQGLITLE